MQRGHSLEFECRQCQKNIKFSIFDVDQKNITCQHCSKKYCFDDEVLIRQLKKFEALCRQIQESEEILGSAYIGVDAGDKSVKIPFKLLLTRLNSKLDLKLDKESLPISFRFEPLQDLPKN